MVYFKRTVFSDNIVVFSVSLDLGDKSPKSFF